MSKVKIIVLHKELSSALKLFYLIIFCITAASIFLDLFIHIERLEKTINHSILLYIFFSVFCFILFSHFMRLYHTMEELENPLSTPHNYYISPLNKTDKKIEQFIRICLITVLSFKLIELIFGIKYFNDLKSLFLYLIIFYLVLISWDFFMIKHGRKKDETYIIQNSICFVSSTLLFIISMFKNKILNLKYCSEIDFAIAFAIGFFLIILATVLSFYRDRTRRINLLGDEEKWEIVRKGFFFKLGTIFYPWKKNILFLFNHSWSPYYGNKYFNESNVIFKPKSSVKFQGSCSQDNCKFEPNLDGFLVLKEIVDEKDKCSRKQKKQ